MPVNFNDELRLSYLRAAHAAQQTEEADIQTYRDFWDGEQGVLLTDRQKEYTTTTPESWGNICPRVVNIPKDRLRISSDGITPAEETSEAYAAKATEWWNADLLLSKQKEVYEASLRDSVSAVIVDWDDTAQRPIFVPNLVRSTAEGLVRFHYDSDNNLIFASKRWTITDTINPGETGKVRLTIYRPGLIDRYESDNNVAGGWRALTPAELEGKPNPQFWTDTGTADGEPLGIPVIPFDNPGGSELKTVIIIQELLNHNLGTMDISIDYHGFPLLWLSGVDLPLNSSGNSTIPDFGPGQAIKLNVDGSMGHLEAADIQKLFDGGVKSWMQVLALIKGWPVYFLDRSQQPPSGVALQMMEGSLVKQVTDKQDVFSGSWAKAFDIGRKLHKIHTAEDLPGELQFNWDSAMTEDKLTEAETKKVQYEGFAALDLPRKTKWRLSGMSPDEVDQTVVDAQSEDEFGLVDFTPATEQ